MHDRHAVVVCSENLAVRAPLVLRRVQDVVQVDGDVLVSVRPVLCVVVAECVEQLMSDVASVLPVAWSQKGPCDQADSFER